MNKETRLINWALKKRFILNINPNALQEPLRDLVNLIQRKYQKDIDITSQWVAVITETERDRYPKALIKDLYADNAIDDSAAKELVRNLHDAGVRKNVERLVGLADQLSTWEYKKEWIKLNTQMTTDIFKSIDDDVEMISGFEFKSIHNPGLKKVPSMFTFMQAANVQFKSGQCAAFIAAPGNGKSLFMHQQAIYTIKNGLNVFYVILEELKDEFMLRHAAILFDIPVPNPIDEQDQLAIATDLNKKAASLNKDNWGNMDIAYYTVRPNMLEIERKMVLEEQERGYEYDMIVIDYSGIVSGIDLSIAEWQQNQEVLENIKKLARAKNKFVLTAMQPNNHGISKEITLASASKSTAGAREMDYVIALKAGVYGEFVPNNTFDRVFPGKSYFLHILKARTSYIPDGLKRMAVVTNHLVYAFDEHVTLAAAPANLTE
jgi:archaellum biogenesis ATPase FlaH